MSQAHSLLDPNVSVAKKYDTVISGMGLSGLASAWQAIKRGKTVLMVSNRPPDYLRVQRVYLKPENRDSLLAMLPDAQHLTSEDKKFVEQIKGNYTMGVKDINYTMGVKDIERFIKRQLDRFPKQINYMYESQFSQLDMHEGKVTIESLRGLPKVETNFDDVIAADGTNHHAVNIFNAGRASELISYTGKTNLKRPHHLSAYIKLERKDGKDLVLPDKNLLVMNDSSTDLLSFLHFNKDSLQNKKNPKAIKCHFLSEIPKELYDKMKNSEMDASAVALPHIESSLKKLLDKEEVNNGEISISIVKPSQKHGVQKDKLKLQCFETNLEEANKVAIGEHGRRFIAVGDVTTTPSYQVGHGAIDALIHAGWVGEIFDGKRTLDQYTKDVKAHANRMHRYGVDLFLFPLQSRTASAEAMESIAEMQMLALQQKYNRQ